MKRNLSISLVIASAFILNGCATVAFAAPVEVNKQSEAQPEKPKTDKKRLFKGAGLGCAAGAGLALILGKKDQAVKGCVAGAVVGGVASYQAQMKEAREVERAAKEAGFTTTVTTKEVETKQGKTEALDALVITYDTASMQAMDAKTSATLDKVTALAKSAKNELTFRFEGKKACEIPLNELRKRGALDKAKVVNACGSSNVNRIVITPIPDVA